MSKLVLADTNSGYNLSVINSNFEKIEQEFNDKVLYRDCNPGEPNEMHNDLDMNGHRIFNLPQPLSPSEPARLSDLIGSTPIVIPSPEGGVSVLAFGADPTGNLDSTTAFQNAVNTGRKVIVPAGIYRMGQILIPSGTMIVGEGDSSIIVPNPGFNTNAFWVVAQDATRVDIGYMQFDLPPATFPTTVPIFLLKGSFHKVHNIFFPGAGVIGVFMIDNTDSIVQDCEVVAAQQHSYQITGADGHRCRIVRSRSGSTVSGHGISIVSGSDHDVIDCTQNGANGFGISYFQTLRGKARGNTSSNSADEGMQITDSSFVEFTDNQIYWDGPGISTDLGISLAAQSTGFVCIGNKIRGNYVTGNDASGIALASTQFLPDQVTPVPGPGLPVQNNEVSGNTIVNISTTFEASPINGKGCGILLYGSGCQGNSIYNNIILQTNSNMLYGVAEFNVSSAWGTALNNRIINNDIKGATAANVLKDFSTVQAFNQMNSGPNLGLVAFTSAVASTAGSLTSAVVNNSSYYETEKKIYCFLDATITTNGTGSGAITFTLPFNAVFGFGQGKEVGVTQKMVQVSANNTLATVLFADGGYPGANGARIQCTVDFIKS